jgi:hypothetical protein
VPFLAFQLKPAGYEALAKKMGKKVDGWIVVFFALNGFQGTTDLVGMLRTLPEYNRHLLGTEEASELLNMVGCSKQETIHKISNISEIWKRTIITMSSEFVLFPTKNIASKSIEEIAKCVKEGRYKLPMRYEFFARKLAAFLHDSAKVNISETDEIFPKAFMMFYIREYLWSLDCVRCGARAFSKCSVCLETRYCGKACQDAIQEQHKEVCDRLVKERQRKHKFEETVVKKMVPDNRRDEFAKFEEKMTASWNKYARDSLRDTELKLPASSLSDCPPWAVTVGSI